MILQHDKYDLKYLKFKTNKFFKNQIVKYSKIIQVTMFTTSQVFVAISPIIFDDGGAQAPKKVTLNPHQNRCSNHCHPGDLEKKNNIKHTGTPGQTLADLTLSNGKKPAYLCTIFFLQLNMVDFE